MKIKNHIWVIEIKWDPDTDKRWEASKYISLNREELRTQMRNLKVLFSGRVPKFRLEKYSSREAQ